MGGAGIQNKKGPKERHIQEIFNRRFTYTRFSYMTTDDGNTPVDEASEWTSSKPCVYFFGREGRNFLSDKRDLGLEGSKSEQEMHPEMLDWYFVGMVLGLTTLPYRSPHTFNTARI